MTVKIPVETVYDSTGFKQLSQSDKEARATSIKMRKLQERHARASLSETKQRIAERKRLLAASKRLEKQIEKEAKAEEKARKAAERKKKPTLRQEIGGAVGGQLIAADLLSKTVGQLKDFAKESLAAGDAAIATSRTFDALSGSSEAAAANMAAMERATRDLISETDQQAIANQLLGMNIATSAQELEKVVGVSRRLGKEFKGLGAREAADDFALMISNMSVARLDSFGLSSGAVRKRIDELLASTEGMTREAAFFQATMEEADKTLARLGPEVGTNADKMKELTARYEDFQASVGKLGLALSDAGLIDPLISLVEHLKTGADAWTRFIDDASLFSDAIGNVGLSFGPTIDEIEEFGSSLLAVLNPLSLIGTGVSAFSESLDSGVGFLSSWQAGLEAQGQLLGDLVVDTIKLATNEEELGQAFANAADAAEKQNTVLADNVTAATEAATAAEEVSEAVRDAARELIDINEDATEDTKEAWKDYYDDLADLGQDSRDNLLEIESEFEKEFLDNQGKFAADSLKIDDKLAEDKDKIAKDLAKDLDKLQKDSAKNITRKQQDFDRDDRQKARRKQIDALGDERLFQFELRQLEAEGAGNAIAAALERRDIEQQIEAEKAVNEQATQDENRAVEIQRMKDDAAERAAELKAEAEERAEQLKAEAEERQRILEEEAAAAEQQRKDELKKAALAEQASFEERRDELGKFVDEKTKAIEDGKKEAIAALAKELQETGDLTKKELGQLVDAAGTFGKQAGEAFAEGLRRGAESVRNLSDLIPSSPGRGRGPRGRGGPAGATPIGFQHGGSFVVGGSGGADSQLVQFMATPGEPVAVGTQQQHGNTPPITINANGVAPDRLASILELKVQEGFQQYNDEIIVPWAEGM